MPVTEVNVSTTTPLGRCPLCDAPLQNPDRCSKCDWVRTSTRDGTPAPRNPRDGIAAILSMLWPGAGHFYKGHTTLAGVIAAGGVLCFLWSVTFFMFFGFLILPIYWVWVAVDAFFRKDLKYPQYYQP